MAHTLRRSRSKYGRTRRQRRKQKRTRGGGFFDINFNDIINKLKPSTPEEKCAKAKQAADEVCGSLESEPVIEQQSGDDLSSSSELNSEMMSPPPIEPTEMMSPPIETTGMMPPPIETTGMMLPSMSEPGMEQKSLAQTQQQPPQLPMQTANFGGSRRKNKKKNKKQSRRKKVKSNKHKK